jgi:hypothetical protein
MSMASVFPENVIPLASAPRRSVSAESSRVINDCRDLAMRRIADLLAKTFDKVEDELFELAEKTTDRDAQNLYLDARAQAREKRGAIEIAFRKQFVSFFDKKRDGDQSAGSKAATDPGAVELTLVDDCDLEEKLALEDIARRLTDTCDAELGALSQRMGFLLSDPELNDEANPIAPGTVIQALKAACDQITAGYQTRITVMRMVEQHMAQDIMEVYRDINRHLISRQILPQIKPGYRKAQTKIVRKTAAIPEAAVPGGAVGSVTGGFGSPANDLFATLQGLMQGMSPLRDDGLAGLAPSPGGDASFASSVGYNASNLFAPTMPGSQVPMPGNADLLDMLTRIQHRLSVAPPIPDTPATGAGDQSNDRPAGAVNVLRQIRAENVTASTSAVDAITIDIVAMLFDYVFDDRSIPDNVKALIARLQIPILKVAIVDKAFFSRKSHPARRLLDLLADASMGIAGNGGRDDPLFGEMTRIVARVQDAYESNLQVFSDSVTELEQVLAARETANDELVERSARAVHEREKRDMGRLIAANEIEGRLGATELPPPVAAMLRGPWARVLERVYLRHGGRADAFNQALATADALIWSVTPKMNAEERRRLVAMLPVLLRDLHEGLGIAAVEASEGKLFFSSLVDCHAAAVKAGLRGESVTALFEASRHDRNVAPLFAKLIAQELARDELARKVDRSGAARIQSTEGGVHVEEITLHKPDAVVTNGEVLPPVGSGATKAAGELAADIKRGTWIEFRPPHAEPIRAKLSWISPLKGVLLFTRPGGQEAISIMPEVLQAQLRCGDARVMDESSAVDRAVDRMVHTLGQNKNA